MTVKEIPEDDLDLKANEEEEEEEEMDCSESSHDEAEPNQENDDEEEEGEQETDTDLLQRLTDEELQQLYDQGKMVRIVGMKPGLRKLLKVKSDSELQRMECPYKPYDNECGEDNVNTFDCVVTEIVQNPVDEEEEEQEVPPSKSKKINKEFLGRRVALYQRIVPKETGVARTKRLSAYEANLFVWFLATTSECSKEEAAKGKYVEAFRQDDGTFTKVNVKLFRKICPHISQRGENSKRWRPIQIKDLNEEDNLIEIAWKSHLADEDGIQVVKEFRTWVPYIPPLALEYFKAALKKKTEESSAEKPSKKNNKTEKKRNGKRKQKPKQQTEEVEEDDGMMLEEQEQEEEEEEAEAEAEEISSEEEGDEDRPPSEDIVAEGEDDDDDEELLAEALNVSKKMNLQSSNTKKTNRSKTTRLKKDKCATSDTTPKSTKKPSPKKTPATSTQPMEPSSSSSSKRKREEKKQAKPTPKKSTTSSSEKRQEQQPPSQKKTKTAEKEDNNSLLEIIGEEEDNDLNELLAFDGESPITATSLLFALQEYVRGVYVNPTLESLEDEETKTQFLENPLMAVPYPFLTEDGNQNREKLSELDPKEIDTMALAWVHLLGPYVFQMRMEAKEKTREFMLSKFKDIIKKMEEANSAELFKAQKQITHVEEEKKRIEEDIKKKDTTVKQLQQQITSLTSKQKTFKSEIEKLKEELKKAKEAPTPKPANTVAAAKSSFSFSFLGKPPAVSISSKPSSSSNTNGMKKRK